MSGTYEIAPIFLIRMAGVPFEPLERLATPRAFVAARQLAQHTDTFASAKRRAQVFLDSGEHLLSEEAYRALRSAVRASAAPRAVADPQPPIFSDYADAAAAVAACEAELQHVLESEVETARLRLVEAARKYLPRQLIFNSGAVRELLSSLTTDPDAPLPRRNTRLRERERHLLLYLQRICAKNDSFSEFGPTSWGKADATTSGITMADRPPITARETFLERWTAHAVAAAITADPLACGEVTPRINPNGLVNGSSFTFADTGESVPLTQDERNIVARCDGRTAAHSLGTADALSALVDKNVIRYAMAVPAMDPHAFSVLCDDVRKWRPGAAREKWLPLLEQLEALPKEFATTFETADRQALLADARHQLQSLGIARKEGERHLYAALNPIGEECYRDSVFCINDAMINEVAVDAAPWIDLWRDTYAYVASRVAAGLGGVLQQATGGKTSMPLPAFLLACEQARLPLTGPGAVALAHLAFQEVKAGFREMLAPHRDKAEYELTADDCHFVRRNFEYPKFDEYTYPSADLQLDAKSPAAVARGEYRWLLAELHPPAALLHHGAYWSCPDHPALSEALASTTCGKPNFHFGFFAADFTAHTTVRLFDALPQHANFVAPQRAHPAWRTFAPADAEVFIDEETGDVGVRVADSQEYLGSFARAWLIPLGFHPFFFTAAPHTPRLRCGRIVVQRRAWTVTQEELGAGEFSGVSGALVTAIEQLRQKKDWPRYVYIRPTEQALRRSGAVGRDKDTKPVFVDLESYLFLEMFHHWLTKAGELEVTEMLPDPEHLCWHEADGRRTFELRTLVVPRS